MGELWLQYLNYEIKYIKLLLNSNIRQGKFMVIVVINMYRFLQKSERIMK